MEAHLVILCWSINFHDADDGDCHAGYGQKVLRVYSNADSACKLIKDWQDVFNSAGREDIVFPIQPNNAALTREFGFNVHDLEQGNYDYKLVHEIHEIQK